MGAGLPGYAGLRPREERTRRLDLDRGPHSISGPLAGRTAQLDGARLAHAIDNDGWFDDTGDAIPTPGCRIRC